jgi:CHAD domain-containing protein
MRAFVERELKLDLEEGFTLPDLGGEPLESRLFTSTYHDTPGRSLARAGITLRRRVENGLSRWQLKLPRGGTARAELEAPGGPVGPPAPLATLLAAHVRHERLAPVATLRTRRAGVRVADNGRTIADVTLDSVAVLDAGRSTGAFAEIEIELVDGDDADLERLGRTLRAAGAKTSVGLPKLMRVLPAPPPLQASKNATAIELLRVLLAEQLRELFRHDPGVRLGDDPEDVHRFRVATRRARALIRATKPLLGEQLSPLAGELKWLARLLGPVRDRDVLIGRLRPETRSLDVDRGGGETLMAQLEDERERLRDKLLDALQSERYLELLDAFELAVASLSEVTALEDADAREIAGEAFRELSRAAKELAPVPADAELHALRITAKRARYGAELAAAGRNSKRLGRYLEALKELQDVIGEHQDAVVAEATLRKLARAKTSIAAGRLIESERLRRAEQRRLYPGVLKATLALGSKAVG